MNETVSETKSIKEKLDEIIKERNELDEKINSINYDTLRKEQRANNAESMQADKAVIESGYDNQIADTENYYNKQIDDAKISYANEYERNAVQKLINEKQIAEKNANLGLTDSGLNRTQQTATQLSYANQKGKIDLARQNAIDTLNLSLTQALTTLKNEKSSSIRENENKWNSYSDNEAQQIYNTKLSNYVDRYNALGDDYTNIYNNAKQIESDEKIAVLEAAARKEEAEIEAAARKEEADARKEEAEIAAESNRNKIDSDERIRTAEIISNYNLELEKEKIQADADVQKAVAANSKEEKQLLWYNTGTYDSDGNPIFRNSDGKTQAFGKGINPYTGTKNADTKNGTFSNGYQPNNVGTYKDKDGNTIVNKLSKTGEKDYVNGVEQNVWEDKQGQKWIWDGTKNRYLKYED